MYTYVHMWLIQMYAGCTIVDLSTNIGSVPSLSILGCAMVFWFRVFQFQNKSYAQTEVG